MAFQQSNLFLDASNVCLPDKTIVLLFRIPHQLIHKYNHERTVQTNNQYNR
jgi:hypothetical protein